MKLVLRILPTVFVLISGTAFADITASDMTWFRVEVLAIGGQADLSGVSDTISGPVSVTVTGAPSTSWFGPPNNFSPGESVLGPGTITWDNPIFLAIGSNLYGAGEPGKFSMFPTALDLPFITLPPAPTGSGPQDYFKPTLFPRFVFELDGTILTGPCFGSCNFKFRSARGELTFNWHYQDGAWHALGLRLNSLPEPGTLPLLVLGIGALGWMRTRSASRARGRSVIPV